MTYDLDDIRANSRDHEGINWHAFGHVSKYSADQTEYAVRKSGIARPKHDVFERLFKNPEDGESESHGNLLTSTGLTRICSLITGTGSLQAFASTTSAVVGVGSTATAANIADVKLGADNSASNCKYQVVDSTPTLSLGVMTAVCTFAADAHSAFAWQEWGWVIATGGVNANTSSANVAITMTGTAVGTTSAVLLNHAITSLGTKSSSASWVFTSTITLS